MVVAPAYPASPHLVRGRSDITDDDIHNDSGSEPADEEGVLFMSAAAAPLLTAKIPIMDMQAQPSAAQAILRVSPQRWLLCAC